MVHRKHLIRVDLADYDPDGADDLNRPGDRFTPDYPPPSPEAFAAFQRAVFEGAAEGAFTQMQHPGMGPQEIADVMAASPAAEARRQQARAQYDAVAGALIGQAVGRADDERLVYGRSAIEGEFREVE